MMSRLQGTIILISLLLGSILLSSCSSSGEEEAVNTIVPQMFLFPGEQELRLISEEPIRQDNCDGSAETSQTIEKQHRILYSLELGSGIKVSADGRAKIPEIGEVGVGVEVATNYNVGYGREEAISRSVTVAAKEGTNIQHTIRQSEVWETGEILIVAGEVNQRFPYSFRRDFSVEALPPANIGCSASEIATPAVSQKSTTVPAPILQNTTVDTLKRSDIDDLFGIDNWFCFPDRENGVGFHQLPQNFQVVSPLKYIDTYIGKFSVGEVVSGWTGGTAELALNLPRSECPSNQQASLAEWLQNRASDSQPFTKERIDALFGNGNWYCLPDYRFGVKVIYLNNDMIVQYPLSTADSPSGKYGIGDTVPGKTEITAWLAGSISRDECP